MNKINSLNEALHRLDQLSSETNIDVSDLKNYITELHAEKQNTMLKLNKLRQTAVKSDTTSSMHSKLKDALYE